MNKTARRIKTFYFTVIREIGAILQFLEMKLKLEKRLTLKKKLCEQGNKIFFLVHLYIPLTLNDKIVMVEGSKKKQVLVTYHNRKESQTHTNLFVYFFRRNLKFVTYNITVHSFPL